MSAGHLSKSRALAVQGTVGSSAATHRASATWSRHSAHPAPVFRQSYFTPSVAALSLPYRAARQRATHAQESVMSVFSIRRGYNSGRSCNPGTAQPIAAADAAAPRLTGRSRSQTFGLATVRVYHRRAAELNRWAAHKVALIDRCRIPICAFFPVSIWASSMAGSSWQPMEQACFLLCRHSPKHRRPEYLQTRRPSCMESTSGFGAEARSLPSPISR